MRRILLAVLPLTVAVSACAPPRARNSSDLAALDRAWEEAFNARDFAKLTSIYADDARLLPPNASMAQGKSGIEAAIREMTSAGLKATLTPIETMVAGDLGHSVGTYEMRDASGAVVDRGKYVETARNVGGEWKFSNDIWNSDMPAAPAVGDRLIIVSKVKDDARWQAAWEKEHGRRELFAQHGAPSVTIFESVENPNSRTLLVDVADMNAFRAWIASPEAAAAKAEDGVLDEGFMVFTPRK